MNNVKFKNPVRVGDTVEFVCSMIKSFGVFHFMKAEGYVGGRVVLKGEFSFALVDPEKAKEKHDSLQQRKNYFESRRNTDYR